ncbi:hypothetical protein CEUSTIGMA_g9883.t1 [Chlamydomonas eustigma]|uniref:Peptidase S54 rhomboid domain-containing protein n=1 Tax=Chlamydomonas eustigma TaxID=1157962 RepID=A0A250XHG2_9CHLO|nr:hypothetical protein CEUSTIGMA_g9883.t1 [Chlamydomonas eustigma]|eukprot:GAX82456.1 hypothetical protein CEUSTIGMA_g9883.t1 [Chlamydomonas eustigma]
MRPPMFNPFIRPGGGARYQNYGRGRHRGHGQDMYFVLLMFQLYQQIASLERKPPITLALILVQAAIHMKDILPLPDDLLRIIPSIAAGSLNPHRVWKSGEWGRLFWSAFLHADEHHLYYNMASLLWKGVQLEGQLGSTVFAALVVELLAVSHSLLVAASYCLAAYFPEYRRLPVDLNVVGFSAVLFGLKVVLNHSSDGWSTLMGVSIPIKYLCWGELALASVINPHASFLGHLMGIMAGIIHVKVMRRVLKEVLMVWNAITGSSVSGPYAAARSAQYFNTSGRLGTRAQTQRPNRVRRQTDLSQNPAVRLGRTFLPPTTSDTSRAGNSLTAEDAREVGHAGAYVHPGIREDISLHQDFVPPRPDAPVQSHYVSEWGKGRSLGAAEDVLNAAESPGHVMSAPAEQRSIRESQQDADKSFEEEKTLSATELRQARLRRFEKK